MTLVVAVWILAPHACVRTLLQDHRYKFIPSLGADFGNKNKKVNIGKGRDWGWILGEGTEEAYFRLPNRREPKDLFPLKVTSKTDKMGV